MRPGSTWRWSGAGRGGPSGSATAAAASLAWLFGTLPSTVGPAIDVSTIPLLAALWTAAPSPFIDERSPLLVVVALSAAAGALTAVTVAALTPPVARSLFAR